MTSLLRAGVRSGVGIAALSLGIGLGFFVFQTPSKADPISDAAYEKLREGRQADAVALYSEQLRSHPKDYVTYLRRGLTYAKTDRPAQALADLTTALRLSPKPQTVEQLGKKAEDLSHPDTHLTNLVVEMHTERAQVLEELNRLDEALTDMDAAVALDSRNYGVLHHRAVLRTFTGQFDSAIADFDRILDHNAGNVESLAARATAKYLQADWKGAAVDFSRAVTLAPKSGNYAVWLLKAQLRSGEPVPLSQFGQLPKDNPAWVTLDAFVSGYSPGEMAARLALGIGSDPVRACRGAVFMGEWLEIKGDAFDAPTMFHDALNLCKPGTVQHALARFELQRLQTMVLTPPPAEEKKPEKPLAAT